jgi:putative ABC transport system permease protein
MSLAKFAMDIRVGLRMLLRSPATTTVMMLVLVLGIGANTAAFSVLYGIVLRPYPYAKPDQLVKIASAPVKNPDARIGVSLADLDDLRQQARTLEAAGAYSTERLNLIVGGAALPIDVTLITSELFSTLGVQPVMGRGFLPEEDRPGGDVQKAILSYALWETVFHRDPNIIGRTVHTNRGTYSVVGVAPPGLLFPSQSAMWIPVESLLALRAQPRQATRSSRRYEVIARLRANASVDDANREAQTIGRTLQLLYPRSNSEILPVVLPLRATEIATMRPYAELLMAFAAVLLAVCAANLANLQLVRATRRVGEFAVRTAMGASGPQLLAQLVTESLLLALLGSLAGVGAGYLLVSALPRLIPVTLPFWVRFDIDGTVLAFVLGLTLTVTLAFGVAPALHAMRLSLAGVLREGARGSNSGSAARRALVVAEVSLAAVSLVCAALLLKSLDRLKHVNSGLRPENVITFRVSPYRAGASNERIDATTSYYRQLTERLEQLPGVIAAGGTDTFPYTPQRGERRYYNLEVKGEGVEAGTHRAPGFLIDVTPGYFHALGIPILEGRAFTTRDTRESQKVIILSQRAAKALFRGRNAVGAQVRHNTGGNADEWAVVVGVAGNVKYRSEEGDSVLEVYFPAAQYGLGSSYFAVRMSGQARGVEAALPSLVASVDPETGIDDVKTMQARIEEMLWQQRCWGAVLTGFAGLTAFLSALGLYAVTSYTVALRRKEIGIRAAIGATQADILRQVTGEGVGLAGIGVIAGIAAAFGASRLLTSVLYGVGPNDPASFALVSLLLILLAAMASILPAIRAASIDPSTVLRD